MHRGGFARAAGLALCLAAAGYAVATSGVAVSGVVRDASGAVVAEAEVSLRRPPQAVVASTRTDRQGRYLFRDVPPGTYSLVVIAAGFVEHRKALRVDAAGVQNTDVTLVVEPVRAEVTVAATLGLIEDTQTVSQPVNVVDAEQINERAKVVVAETAQEEPGLHLQRTSPTVAGIFVRGLTGNKVNVFVDGVRYSNSAQRSGINTFLDLIEPSELERVEVLRGPGSAQYGSDAIGGSVQFVTRSPTISSTGPSLHGTFGTFFQSADWSAGSHLSLSSSGRNFGAVFNFAGRRVNTLRAGQALDSHSAFRRFFGLPSSRFLDERLPDTAFTQYAGLVKLHWFPRQDSQVIAHYSRSQQDGGKRYDQLLGGDGNLIANLRNLMLDFFYVRYDRQRAGWLDDFNVSYSFNSQREERVNQGGNGDPHAAVNHEYERTTVHGFQAAAGKSWKNRHILLFGGDYYHEAIRSPSFSFFPATETSLLRRPRIPDGARYLSGGFFLQHVFDALPNRLRLVGALRFSAASYRAQAGDSPIVSGQTLWPDDSLTVSNVSFRAGAAFTPRPGITLRANLSRGFRAPHMTDLGTLGVTGAGFEVAAPDLEGLNALVGSTADRNAVSTGIPAAQLEPETSLNYEGGLHVRLARFQTDLAFFVNDIHDAITRQSLILPPGAVGLELGGQPIIAQLPNGVVFVAVATNPVLLRANFDDARIHGWEHTLRYQFAAGWTVSTVFTYVHTRDTRTDLPPNLEGGTPAPDGYLKIRYTRSGGRFWVEPYVHAADRQSRLSTLDLEDRRTGAMRSRASIQNFFLNGATARGLVARGPDSLLGTADDVLIETGETLGRIQNRVLGPGVNAAPLFMAVPGYVTLNLRGGVRFRERHEVLADFQNLADRNYRGISWGVDAPGRSLMLRYSVRF